MRFVSKSSFLASIIFHGALFYGIHNAALDPKKTPKEEICPEETIVELSFFDAETIPKKTPQKTVSAKQHILPKKVKRISPKAKHIAVKKDKKIFVKNKTNIRKTALAKPKKIKTIKPKQSLKKLTSKPPQTHKIKAIHNHAPALKPKKIINKNTDIASVNNGMKEQKNNAPQSIKKADSQSSRVTQTKQLAQNISQSQKETQPSVNPIKNIGHNPSLYKIGTQYTPMPSYPRIARLRHYQGVVEISALINKKGDVVKATLHRSSGYSILDKSALRTIKKWTLTNNRFRSLVRGNQKFLKVIIPVQFLLQRT